MKNVFRQMTSRGFVHHFQSSRTLIRHTVALIVLPERTATKGQFRTLEELLLSPVLWRLPGQHVSQTGLVQEMKYAWATILQTPREQKNLQEVIVL